MQEFQSTRSMERKGTAVYRVILVYINIRGPCYSPPLIPSSPRSGAVASAMAMSPGPYCILYQQMTKKKKNPSKVDIIVGRGVEEGGGKKVGRGEHKLYM